MGDRVWRKNVRSQQRKGGKLEANYLGPFTIIALEEKSADLEDERGVKFPKINIDHIKPHLEDIPRVPHKLKKPSKVSKIQNSSISAASPSIYAPQIPNQCPPASPGISTPQTPLQVSPSYPAISTPKTANKFPPSSPFSTASQTPTSFQASSIDVKTCMYLVFNKNNYNSIV